MSNSTTTSDSGHFVYFRYDPSLPAAIIFAVLFLLSTLMHMFQAFRKRSYYFIPLIVGGLFEVGGYADRAVAHYYTNSQAVYIVQVLLLLVAPALFAASIYMTLGRIIVYTNAESMSPIRVRWLTKIFVCGDIISFLLQALGGGLSASSSSADLGKTIIVIGLVFQIAFFGFFLICGGLFHWRLIRSPTPSSEQLAWRKYMYTLYAAGILILIRSVFRVVEFEQGNDGTIQTHEVYLYVFDGVLMLGVVVLFNFVHPGNMTSGKAAKEDVSLESRVEHGYN